MLNIISNLLFKILSKSDKKIRARFFALIENSHYDLMYENYRKNYQIDDSFRFNGKGILFYGKGKIICGNNSYIGNGSTIQADMEAHVTIGSNCSISHNVRMYTISNKTDQDFTSNERKDKLIGSIVIGNGVWIGANVFINPGINIGNNVVVGANSVVTKDLIENGIYGGVPARLIRYKDYE